jgi:hypothetical protein
MAEAQKESERKGIASFKGGAEAIGAAEEEHLMVTMKMHKIVRVEKLDKSGKHHEVEPQEWAKLLDKDELNEIELALEEAFEAGIAAVLGEEYEDDDEYEDDEERSLRQSLIAGLLRRRPVQRRILQRVVVSRLLRRQSAKRSTR